MRILAEVLQLRDALLLVAQVVGLDLFCHHSGLRHWSWRRHGSAKTCQVEFGRSELPDQKCAADSGYHVHGCKKPLEKLVDELKETNYSCDQPCHLCPFHEHVSYLVRVQPQHQENYSETAFLAQICLKLLWPHTRVQALPS